MAAKNKSGAENMDKKPVSGHVSPKSEDDSRQIGIRVLIREAVLGYVFWSLYQAVAPMIWFYPLNELEVTGFEAFAAVKCSPILLGIGPLRRLVAHRWALAVIRLASIACLASFQTAYTFNRLVILCVGCFFVMWVLVVTLWSSSVYQRTCTFWGLMLGLFMFLVSRIWFVSFVPTWWTDATNSGVIALAAIATIDKILSGDDALREAKADQSKRPNWFLTSIGFGSLLYLTIAIFGEVSVICRWVVKGHPDPGPMPNPWGLAVLFALAIGLLIGVYTSLSTSAIWWLVGAASLAALYLLPTWQGFGGGLVLAVYTMSLWPEMADRMTLCPPARSLALASVLFVAQVLFSVWTVAFNFVPGGEYTREHTDWLLGYVAFTLALATLTGKKNKPATSPTSCPSINKKSMPNSSVRALLLVLMLWGIAGFVVRHDPQRYVHKPKVKEATLKLQEPGEQSPSPKVDFTAAIWAFHFGYDNQGWPSMERAATFLNNSKADIITLLESDASKPFLGNNDLGMWLGEKLGMYVDFGPSTKDHTWGNLILSKYPIVKSNHHLLPSPFGELAPGITATVDINGHLVDFVATHMGNDRDMYDRELQAKFLSEELSNVENPVVFLGYVTSRPFSRDYRQLINHGRMKDIDDTDDDRWCEYIMYRDLIRLGYARVSHGGLSDTELQMARFRIPVDPTNYKDKNRIVTRPPKRMLDKGVRFTLKFGTYMDYHNWGTFHSYHMSTPKYFL